MVDGRFSRIETGKPARVEAGEHTFQINAEDGQRYRVTVGCPEDGTFDMPIVIDVHDAMDPLT